MEREELCLVVSPYNIRIVFVCGNDAWGIGKERLKGKRRVGEGHIVILVEIIILFDCFWEQGGPWGPLN